MRPPHPSDLFTRSAWWLAVLAVGALAHIALAQGAKQASGLSIADAPRSADAVIVLDNLGRLRGTQQGSAILAMARELGLLEDIAPAWDRLAAQLGWTRQEAVDRLVGRRVVFLARSGAFHIAPYADDSGPPQWAILAEVSPDTEQRLRSTLAAAPRGVLHGHQILAVEQGKYELTTHREKGALAVVVLLGPAGESGLFDDALAVLAGSGADRLADSEAVGAVGRVAPANVLALFRTDIKESDRWSGFQVFGLSLTQTGVAARMLAREPSCRDALRALPPRSDAPLLAMRETAIAVALEWRPDCIADETQRQMIEGLLARFATPPGMLDMLGSGQLVAVFPSESPAGISLACGLEIRDTAAAAPVLDRFIAGRIVLLEQVLGASGKAGQPRQAPDFAGVFPGAVRVVDVALPDAVSLFRDHVLRLSWSYPSGDPISGGGPGWWLVRAELAPTADVTAGAADPLTELLTGTPTSGRRRPWLSLGSVEPDVLADRLARWLPDAAWRRALGRIDSMRWEFCANADGDVEGTFQLDLRPDAPAAPGQTPPGAR